MLENRIQKDKLCLQLQLLTKIDQRYKCHGYTHVRWAHLYLFREKEHWWPVLVCWHKETGTRPWLLLLAFCASLGLIPSGRGADDLPVGNKQGDTGQDQFLPTPGMGFAVSEVPGSTWHGKAGEGSVCHCSGVLLGMQKKRLSLWKQQQHCQEHVPVNFS